MRGPPWLWNPGQTSPEFQNMGVSDTPQKGLMSFKIKKKSNDFLGLSVGDGSENFIDTEGNSDS